MNAFDELFSELSSVTDTGKHLSKSEWAERYLLNPRIKYAVKDDPDGSYHAKDLQITNSQGDPLPGLVEGQPIPLILRWYQRDIIDSSRRLRVLRCGRRTGKTFLLSVEVVVEALRDPNAKILVLAPAENHVKVLFDDYIRPLFAAYRHEKSGRIGIPSTNGEVPEDCDFAIVKDTQKPQEIVVTDGKDHHVTIRGMVISNSARGQSATFLVFDEADYAKTEDVQAIVAPIIMTQSNTRIVMSSTPTGRRDSFFYEKCHDSDWKPFHYTFKVLPHYNEELHREMAKMAGGEDTNTFKQEYLAEFGAQTEGVFDQEALNQSFVVAPYVRVLEDIDPRTRERRPLLATAKTDLTRRMQAHYEGVQPVSILDEIGAESIYRPEYRGHGVVTAGTDWNDVAGMQTCLIWWPPAQWLEEGRIEVARFPYNRNEPVVSERAKSGATPQRFKVGHTNGNPGGPHDLSQVRGIVIWHGRLESGHFNWQSAANRAIGLMSVDNFLDAWYVDEGYGAQVIKMIEQIMAASEYIPDMNLLHQSRRIEEPLMRQIRRFHPDSDPEKTGKLFKPIRFGNQYKHLDFDFSTRGDRYKDVMVGLSKVMVAGRRLLFPYGELTGFHQDEELGENVQETFNSSTGEMEELRIPVDDRDIIEATGAEMSRGERTFGGLVTQMREWRVDGVSPNGKPRYSGADHAIDAFMLAVLAYFENFSEEGPGNMFRPGTQTGTHIAEDLLSAADKASQRTRRRKERAQQQSNGAFQHKNYSSERGPLEDIYQGRSSPEEAGTSLDRMLKMARRHWRG